MNIPWLKPIEDGWRKQVAYARVPHAVLLLGPVGVGKRTLAAWFASERLGLSGAADGAQYPLVIPAHADLHWLSPPEDKHSIGIEQIRALVADLSLTSYEGGRKVAIIEPANTMTANATNGLLKTLEEPPGDALLVLLADRMGHLPATILSRCQRINVSVPEQALSLPWLDRVHPSSAWREALQLAGDAPLAAISAIEQLHQASDMLEEFAALPAGRLSPIDIAARWENYDTQFCLEWLSRTVQQAIKRASCGASGALESGLPESVLRRIDRRNLFCYLDIINGLRGQAAGSFNVQLTLESLLIHWAGGLKDCHRSFHPGEELPVAKSR